MEQVPASAVELKPWMIPFTTISTGNQLRQHQHGQLQSTTIRKGWRKYSAAFVLSVGIWMFCLTSDRFDLTEIGTITGRRDLALSAAEASRNHSLPTSAAALLDDGERIIVDPTPFLLPKKRAIYYNESFSKEILDEIDQIPLTYSSSNLPPTEEGERGLALIGFFCRAGDQGRRQLLRRTNLPTAPPGVSVKFIICSTSSPSPELQEEINTYGDIYLLSCAENMNNGKSYDFFRSVSHDFPHYDYYVKADMDTYVLLHNLAMALERAPRCYLYAGRSNFDLYHHFDTKYMSGAIYILSRDLVEWIGGCPVTQCDAIGRVGRDPEDVMTGKLVKLKRGEKVNFGDFGPNHSALNAFDFEMQPQMVMVHFVKEEREWMRVHDSMRERVNMGMIRGVARENFWDGRDTDFFDFECLEKGR